MRTCTLCNLQQRDSEFDTGEPVCRQCVALESLTRSLGNRHSRLGGYVKGEKTHDQEESRQALIEYERAEYARRQRADPPESFPEPRFTSQITIAQWASRIVFGQRPTPVARWWCW